jgi:hypothetical protein
MATIEPETHCRANAATAVGHINIVAEEDLRADLAANRRARRIRGRDRA